jgi:hypothetical protein
MNAKQARTTRRKLVRENGHLFVAMRIVGVSTLLIDHVQRHSRQPPHNAVRSIESLLARLP